MLLGDFPGLWDRNLRGPSTRRHRQHPREAAGAPGCCWFWQGRVWEGAEEGLGEGRGAVAALCPWGSVLP